MRNHSKRGANRPRFSTPFVLLLNIVLTSTCLFALGSQANATTLSDELLNEISSLSQQGAEELSFLLLQEAQPNIAHEPEAWSRWHHKKIELLRQKGRWFDVIQEYETLPQNVPDDHRHRVLVELARAYIATGAGEQARDVALSLIWNTVPNPDRMAEWRQLVVQSYLVDGRNDHAHTAVLRYEQDYENAGVDPDWLGLKARLLIETDRASEAAILTVVSEQPTARSAYVLATLKGHSPLNEDLLDEALEWLNHPALDITFKQSLFSALFEKSKQIVDWSARITALEKLLGVDQIELTQITAVADALWFGLTEYGHQLANQNQLLVGNFGPWFDKASELSQTETNQAEAIYAWLATKAQGTDINAKAHELLVNRLAALQRNGLVRSLYLSSSQFADVNALPLALMFRMVDMALTEGNAGLATKLMNQLDAPKGVDIIEWQLRRARVQILAGQVETGAGLLKEIVSADSLTSPQIANALLAAQDLINLKQYAIAFLTLEQLLAKVPESAWRYQLLFWMAEARMAQQRFSDAARLYLRSASLAANDPSTGWLETAHQRAAFALERAGLDSDATHLFQALLPGANQATHSVYQTQIRRLTPAVTN